MSVEKGIKVEADVKAKVAVLTATVAPKSMFIPKLHESLHKSNSTDFRWTSADTFHITSSDLLARQALSQSWDFRSLSSFIRQLSYYGFKRLSDRRRSIERRSSSDCINIVFGHPSGFFRRDDPSTLDRIVRKTRPRKTADGSSRRSRKRAASSPTEFSNSFGSGTVPGKTVFSFESSYQWNPPSQANIAGHQQQQQHQHQQQQQQQQQQQYSSRPKPNLHLTFSSHQSEGPAPHEVQWGSRISPYPTPLHAPGQYVSPLGSTYYTGPVQPQSYFQEGVASYEHSPSPLKSNPMGTFHPLQPTLEENSSSGGPFHRITGGMVAPPSPSDSHSFASLSPRCSEPDEYKYSQNMPGDRHTTNGQQQQQHPPPPPHNQPTFGVPVPAPLRSQAYYSTHEPHTMAPLESQSLLDNSRESGMAPYYTLPHSGYGVYSNHPIPISVYNDRR